MLDALLIFTGGLLGSAHCVGMCGGFVLSLGAARPALAANLTRQLVYASGRVSVYAAAGAFAGFAGWRLARAVPALVQAQGWLSVVAGLVLVGVGLAAAGVLPRWWWREPKSCPGAREFAALLRAPGLAQVFVAGMVNGLLPCGLVYGYLALAASTGQVLTGLLVMLLFGLGTVPALVLTGVGGSFLSGQAKRRVFALAAWCVVVTGVITLARGAHFLTAGAGPGPHLFCAVTL